MLNFLPSIIYAQFRNPAVTIPGDPSSPTNFFGRLIGGAISFLLVASALIFMAMLIAGSISWIGAGGDKAALESAKAKVTSALIGIVVVFCVYAVVTLVGDVFGIDLLRISIQPLNVSFGGN